MCPGLGEQIPELRARFGACTEEDWGRSVYDGRVAAWEGYARKAASGEALTDAEQSDIRGVGLWLLEFFPDGEGVREKSPFLVADMSGDSPTGRIFHEEVGPFNPIEKWKSGVHIQY